MGYFFLLIFLMRRMILIYGIITFERSDNVSLLHELGIMNLVKLDGFHNEVYLGEYDGEKLIIRISKSQRRSKEYVLAEVAFIESLQNYVQCVEPFILLGSSVFEEGDQVIALFKFVEGPRWNQLEHTDDIIYQAGKQLALIHKTSSQSKQKFMRDDYKKHNDLQLYLKNFKDEIFVKEYEEVLSVIDSYNNEEYFLIHGDYLYSNMIYNTRLTIIDFDDCEYGYSFYDFAVYMFYYLLGGNPSEMDIKGNRKRFEVFLEGYQSERKIELKSLEDLNPFFRLRQMKLMGTITEYSGEKMGIWQKRFIETAIDRIKNKKNFIA